MLGQAGQRRSRQILPSAVLEVGGQGRTWAAQDNSSSPGPWELEQLQETKEILYCRQALPPAWASCSNRQSQDRQENGDMCLGNAVNRESPVLSCTSWTRSRTQSDHSTEQQTGGVWILNFHIHQTPVKWILKSLIY